MTVASITATDASHCRLHVLVAAQLHVPVAADMSDVRRFPQIDAIGGARFDDGAGGDNEVQRTMLEIVNQLDGFDSRGNIKVWIGAAAPAWRLAVCQSCSSPLPQCAPWFILINAIATVVAFQGHAQGV